jgi:hypothetical protein
MREAGVEPAHLSVQDPKSSDGIDARPDPATGSPCINERFSLSLPYEAEIPPDLATVVAAWPDLPEAVRGGIVAMVKAVKP